MKKYIILMVSSLLTTASYAASAHIEGTTLDTQTESQFRSDRYNRELQRALTKNIKLYNKYLKKSPQRATFEVMLKQLGSSSPREVRGYQPGLHKLDEYKDSYTRYILIWETLEACNCPVLVPVALCWLYGVIPHGAKFDLSKEPGLLPSLTPEIDSIAGTSSTDTEQYYQKQKACLNTLTERMNKCIAKVYACLSGKYKVQDATPYVQEFTNEKHRFTIAQPSAQHTEGETFATPSKEGVDADESYDSCLRSTLSRLAGMDQSEDDVE